MLRSILRQYLESIGYPTVSVPTRQEALECMGMYEFAYIVMDYISPEPLSAEEFVQTIHRRFPSHHIAIILLTAFTRLPEPLGVDRMLVKPMDLTQLPKVLRELASRVKDAGA